MRPIYKLFPGMPGELFTRIWFFDQPLITAPRKSGVKPSTPYTISPHAAVHVSVSITGSICSEHTGGDVIAPQRLRYHREAPSTCRAQVFSKMSVWGYQSNRAGEETKVASCYFRSGLPSTTNGWCVPAMVSHIGRQLDTGFLELLVFSIWMELIVYYMMSREEI